MARLTFSQREAARVLGLPDADAAVDTLVQDGTLPVAAVSSSGPRYFFAEDVRRAGSELALATATASRRGRRKAKDA
jgi:hypothetical protein